MSRVRCQIDNIELLRRPDFFSQYFKTYSIRLSCQNAILEKLVFDKYGSDANIKKLSDIVPEEKCVVIGTIYKVTENKPSLIKEHGESGEFAIQPTVPLKLTSSKDLLFLEESQQIIQLDSNHIDVSQHVTGIVVAVFGYESEEMKAKFVVEDIIYATPVFPLMKQIHENDDAKYIAIISGLQIDDNEDNVVLIKLCFDWICGLLPIKGLDVDPRRIGRLIIAGDSVREDRQDKLVSENKFTMKKCDVNTATSLAIVDHLVGELCQSIPVDLMAGTHDPTSSMMPQPAINHCLFPLASKWATFNTRPNPWMFYMDDGSLVVGTAGQNIDDINRYSDIDDPLDRLQATIKWGHVAPTAPDSLKSYPNDGPVDPLVMPHRPSLYFAGNQDRFAWTNDSDNSLLVTVPRFCHTRQLVLVDVVNKRCQSLAFK